MSGPTEKRLDEPVRTVMSSPVETIDADATVAAAADRLCGQIGSLVVGDADGIITETDVVRAVSRGASPTMAIVSSWMSEPVVTVSADESVRTAAKRMADEEVKHLPVVAGEVVGMISSTDVTHTVAPTLDDLIGSFADD